MLVETTQEPPPAQCDRIAARTAATPSASSATVGSSSSQSGAADTAMRARASRRRWPADRNRAGRSASAARPNSSSAGPISPRPGRKRRQAEQFERRADFAPARAEGCPETQILGHRERQLHRVEMTHEMKPCRMRVAVLRDVGALPFDATGNRREEPGHDPQQARLAAAVGAGQHQGFAGSEREVEFGEHPAVAANAGQRAAREQCRRIGARAVQREADML